jgi:hypothetical protein
MVNHSEGKMLKLRMKFHYDDIVSIVHFGFIHQGVRVRTNQLGSYLMFWYCNLNIANNKISHCTLPLASSVYERLEVLKSSVFCDIATYSPLKINQHFEGTCRLPLQGQRICQVRNQHRGGWFLSWLILLCWRWRSYVLPKSQMLINRLQGIVYQKTEFLLIQSHPYYCQLLKSYLDAILTFPSGHFPTCKVWGSHVNDFYGYCFLGFDAM